MFLNINTIILSYFSTFAVVDLTHTNPTDGQLWSGRNDTPGASECIGAGWLEMIAVRCCRLALPDNLIVTPFAQILHSLRTVRNNYILFTSQPQQLQPDQHLPYK